jgi:hypothetical protein
MNRHTPKLTCTAASPQSLAWSSARQSLAEIQSQQDLLRPNQVQVSISALTTRGPCGGDPVLSLYRWQCVS